MTDSNVFQLSQPGALSDPLTEVLRSGARALLAQAVAAEVAWFLESHADKLTDDGRQRLVHHGHLPEREIMAIGRARSLEELAQREGITRCYIRRLVNLAFLSPDLVETFLDGRQPVELTATRLTEIDLPLDWSEQQRLLAS